MLMGWGVMSFHQKLFFQPKILKGFIFRGPFVWIWKRQRQVVAYLGAWEPPKLASFTFFNIWAMIGPCSDWIPLRFPIFQRFLSSNSELPHKVITCFFYTISADISQFYSFGLLRISPVTYVEASLRTMTRFPIWCFFFPISFGDLKSRWSSTKPCSCWARLVPSIAMWSQAPGPRHDGPRVEIFPWALNFTVLVGSLGRQNTKSLFYFAKISSSHFHLYQILTYRTRCVRRGCVFFVFLCCFMIILRNNNQGISKLEKQKSAPGRSKRCLRWSLPWLAFWSQHTRQKLGEGRSGWFSKKAILATW